MSELSFDHSLWPLCILSLQGQQSLEQHREMMEVWDRWLSREDDFIVLRVYQDSASLNQLPGIAKATKKWLQSGAAKKIINRISAMLMVIPEPDFQLSQHASVETVFGVKGGIFPDLTSAVNWLQIHTSLQQDILLQAEKTVLSLQSDLR